MRNRKGKKHHGSIKKQQSKEKEREVETIRLINEALDKKDLQQLRKLAAVRGLVNNGLRVRAWGMLAGADPSLCNEALVAACATCPHRDTHVVKVDVERSLWAFMPGASDAERGAKRVQLERLLNAVVGYFADPRPQPPLKSAPASAASTPTSHPTVLSSSSSTSSGHPRSRGSSHEGYANTHGTPAHSNGHHAHHVPASSFETQVAVHEQEEVQAVGAVSREEEAAAQGGARERGQQEGRRTVQHLNREEAVTTPCPCHGSCLAVDNGQEGQEAQHSGQAKQGEQWQQGEQGTGCATSTAGDAQSPTQRHHTQQQQQQKQSAVHTARQQSQEVESGTSTPVAVLPPRLTPASNQPLPPPKPITQDVFYYQGLHDVASVLLLVGGSEGAAFPVLVSLASGHLRDATRASLDSVLEVLGLLYAILDVADSQLAAALRAAGLPPYFALSWAITWFAHDVPRLDDAARLFDLFLASHPLMPLYVGAAAMRAARTSLLACEEMPEMHSALVNLRLSGLGRGLDDLAADALQLARDAPPSTLIRNTRLLLTASVTPAAVLQGDAWVMPTTPPDAHRAHTGRIGRGNARNSGAGAGGGPRALLRFLRQLAARGVRVGGSQGGAALEGPRATRQSGPVKRPEVDVGDEEDVEVEESKGSFVSTALSLTSLMGVYLFATFISYTVSHQGGGSGG